MVLGCRKGEKKGAGMIQSKHSYIFEKKIYYHRKNGMAGHLE